MLRKFLPFRIHTANPCGQRFFRTRPDAAVYRGILICSGQDTNRHDAPWPGELAANLGDKTCVAGIDPRAYRRQPTRPEDGELRARPRELSRDLSGERRRFGYRRLHILLRREDWAQNWRKLSRNYREEGLTVRNP